MRLRLRFNIRTAWARNLVESVDNAPDHAVYLYWGTIEKERAMLRPSFGLSLGRIVQVCRAIEGLHQSDLAKRLKITRVFLSRIENDWVAPSDEIVHRLTTIFGLDPTLLRRAKLYRPSTTATAGDIFHLLSHRPTRANRLKTTARNRSHA